MLTALKPLLMAASIALAAALTPAACASAEVQLPRELEGALKVESMRPQTRQTPFIGAGSTHACWVKADKTIACRSSYAGQGQASPPRGEFSSVSAKYGHNCGVRTVGSVACWGRDYDGQASPPVGDFTAVSAGWFHSCGVRPDGTVACWGNVEFGRASPPTGEFSSVSAGFIHS